MSIRILAVLAILAVVSAAATAAHLFSDSVFVQIVAGGLLGWAVIMVPFFAYLTRPTNSKV